MTAAPPPTASTATLSLRSGASRNRVLQDRVVRALVYFAFALALTPLVLVLYYTIAKGAGVFSASFFTHDNSAVIPTKPGGGIEAAMVGTVEQVGIASLISIPLGLLAAIYIVEYGRGTLRRVIRFFVDVMTGVPSIVAGLFIYAFLIVGLHWNYLGFAGALALVVLMLPVLIRSAEEMIVLVPNSLREASLALGVPRWRTILRIVIPTAASGLTTAVMLAIARVTGETAPLLLTVGGSKYVNWNPFSGHQDALPIYIWNGARQAYNTEVDRAWGAALALILIVIILYIGARLITRRAKIPSGR